MLTNSELRQIKDYLAIYGKKDSQLRNFGTGPLLDTDYIAIVRDNDNVIIQIIALENKFIEDFLAQPSHYSSHIDDVPTDGSVNFVRSNGVYHAINDDGVINTSQIKDGAVTIAKIADGNITEVKIANGAVTYEKLAQNAVRTYNIQDGSITTAKIADGNVTTSKLANSSVTHDKVNIDTVAWEQLTEDMRIRISSIAPGGVSLANEWGDSLDFGITQDFLTKANTNLQNQIDSIISSQAVVSLSAKISGTTVVFVRDSAYTVNLSASSNFVANTINISRGGSSIASTTNASTLSGTESIVLSSGGTTTYTATFGYTGATKTASGSVTAVYPIYYGSGGDWTDATTQVQTPKTSPAGTYNVTVSTNGDNIFFVVPSTMTINHASMGGFDFPLENAVSVTKDGIAYKSYQSSNTYDAGTWTIVIS